MSDWRYGDTNPVVSAVDSATVIEIGDLLWQDTDDAKPASMLGTGGSHFFDQGLFASTFLGVAMQRSRSGYTEPVRVATTGVFEFDCPSGTFELGDLVGADENAGALLNQQVKSTRTPTEAIGRVALRRPSPDTSVFVGIRSTVMTGGVAGSIKF